MIQAQIEFTSWWWHFKNANDNQRITLGDLPMDCVLHYPHGYDENNDHWSAHVFKVFANESEIIPWIKSLPDYGQGMKYVIRFEGMISDCADMTIEIYNDYRE